MSISLTLAAPPAPTESRHAGLNEPFTVSDLVHLLLSHAACGQWLAPRCAASKPLAASSGIALATDDAINRRQPALHDAACAEPARQGSCAIPLASGRLDMHQADWPQHLGELVQWHLGVGIQETRIEISPQHLGTVRVRLSVDDEGLRLQLGAIEAETFRLLQTKLDVLCATLHHGGVPLAAAVVAREHSLAG